MHAPVSVRSSSSKAVIALLFVVWYVWIYLETLHPLQDPTLWWHLAAGRQIVRLHAIPFTDTFSSTAAGTRWVNSYWLYDVLVFILYTYSGFNGIILLHALAVLGLLYFVDCMLRENEVHWAVRLAALSTLYFGAGPAGGYWGPQPSLVTLFFVSLLLWQMDRWKRRGWFPSLWVWPFLFLLWANLHRGFLLGLCIAGAFAWTPQAAGQRRRFGGWLLLCTLASFLTPRPLGLFHMMLDDVLLSSQRITGWLSPSFSDVKVYVATVFAFCGVVLSQWKKELRYGSLLLLAAFLLVGSLRHLVYVSYFMFFAVPPIAIRLSAFGHSDKKGFWDSRAEVWLVAMTLFLTAFGISHARPALGAYGSHAYDFIREKKISGPFYNDYRLGGAWMWAFDGHLPVFIDGRYPAVEGYKSLAREWVAATASITAWNRFLDRYGIQVALVENHRDNPRPSLHEAIFPRDRWALVYWDDNCSLFLRRGKLNDAVIRREEYVMTLPDAQPSYTLARLRAMSRTQRRLFGEELTRNAATNPDSPLTKSLINLFLAHHLDSANTD